MSATTCRIGETLIVTIKGRAVLATCIGETEDGEIVIWRAEDGDSSGTWWARLWDLSRLRQGCERRDG